MTAKIADTVTRPDGRVYKSRKVIAHVLYDEDEVPCMVLVLGTHDIERARLPADSLAIFEGFEVGNPYTGWWRESIRDHRPRWVDDDVRGRAGVMFREIADEGRGHDGR